MEVRKSAKFRYDGTIGILCDIKSSQDEYGFLSRISADGIVRGVRRMADAVRSPNLNPPGAREAGDIPLVDTNHAAAAPESVVGAPIEHFLDAHLSES
jgi:hypothetical protein